MSLPIPPAAMIQGAVQLASGVASRVSQAIGFDDVLRGGQAETAAPPKENLQDAESFLTRLKDQVRNLLKSAGIAVNQSLDFEVSESGSLRVDEAQPRAAEIELLLNADESLAKSARELSRLGGSTKFSIDLTESSVPVNMVAPGGYPNW